MTEVEFHNAIRLRAKHTIIWLVIAVSVVFGSLVIASSMELTGGLFVLPTVPLLLIPLKRADQKAAEFAVPCPACHEDLARFSDSVLATRCCRVCNTRVLEGGRVRSDTVWRRLQRIRQHRFLGYWLWAWPALFGLFVVMAWFDPVFARG